jgi:type I restriction enzyme S subunit
MQGKLVPQDPNDPPASQLLKEIAAEKKRLVKEGRIKTTKPLPSVTADEMPYTLPRGWEWVRLGNCMLKITDGTHHSPPNTESGDCLYISAKNIKDDGVLLGNATYVTKEVHDEIYARCNPEYGNLLYIKDGATTGIVTINNLTQPFSMLSSVALLKQPPQVDNRFLLYTLRSPFFYREMRAGMTGVAITRVTLTILNNALIPLPPLKEQRHVVAKIDQLMARCDELERLCTEREQKRRSVHTAALKQLLDAHAADSIADAWQFISRHFGDLYAVKENVTELRKAVLQFAVMGKLVPQNPNDPPASQLLKEVVTEKRRLVKEGMIRASKPLPEIKEEEIPFSLPVGWMWTRLGEIGYTNIGLTYTPSDVADTGIPVLRSNNIQNGKLDLSELKRVEVQVKESVLVQEGDLLICARNGSKALVGKTALITNLTEPMAFGAFMAIFRSPFNQYLLRFINSPLFRRMIDDVNTMTINQITQDNLRSTLCPLPPLAEQHGIVAKIDQLMALCDTLEHQIDTATSKQTELLDALMAPV